MICKICNAEISNKGFSSHIKYKHIGIDAKEYYDTYIGTKDECFCICGKENKFLGIFSGYSKHCSRKCSMNDDVTTQKRIKTNIQKYGTENVYQSEEIKNKIKKTWIAKYGVDNPNKSIKVREKIRQTNLSRYGVETPMQNGMISHKRKMTCETRYHCSYPTQNNNIMLQVIDSKQNTIRALEDQLESVFVKRLIDEYGSGWSQSQLKEICFKKNGFTFVKREDIAKIQLYNKCNGSYIEYFVYNELVKHNIYFIHHDRQQIKPYELDFYIPDKRIGIECNGYFHDTDCKRINRNNDEYHKMKQSLCEKANIKLINVDTTNINIFNILGSL